MPAPYVPLAPKAMLLNTQLNSLIALPWNKLKLLWALEDTSAVESESTYEKKKVFFFFVVGAEFSLNSECLKAY